MENGREEPTGKEIELGATEFNLAKYAKDPMTTSKLYVNKSKEMYIEIIVKSRPVDAKPEMQAVTPQTVVNYFANSN